MLSFLESKSASYVLLREGRVSRPDENFARGMNSIVVEKISHNLFSITFLTLLRLLLLHYRDYAAIHNWIREIKY